MKDPHKIEIEDLPFFARFLENQIPELPEVEAKDVIGGKVIVDSHPAALITNAYPSDREDSLPVQTLKYPSDGEDSHGGRPPIHPRPPIMTKKYPSDFEETFHH